MHFPYLLQLLHVHTVWCPAHHSDSVYCDPWLLHTCMTVACAEGTTLGLFSFDKMKSKKKTKQEPVTQLIRFECRSSVSIAWTHTHTHTHIHTHTHSTDASLVSKWSRGCILGSAQNFARELMESPANHMTPTMFVEAVSNKLGRMRHSLSNPSSLQVVPRYIDITYVCTCTCVHVHVYMHMFMPAFNFLLLP